MPASTPRGYTFPLYSDPANFPSQIQTFAQDVDLDVQSLVNDTTTGLNRPSARVSATANQLIAVSTFTFATFAVEEYDNASMVNLGVNNDRITFTEEGIYLVHAECNWVPNGNATLGARFGELLPNLGGNPMARQSLRGAQSMDVELSLTSLWRINTVGDFVRFQVRQNSGAGANISARSMSVTKVAD